MKYIVTGGLGVIGSRFVEEIYKAGHTAIIIDAAEEKRNLWMKSKLESKFNIDIRCERLEKFDLDSLLKDCDAILHAAAHTGIPHSTQDPSDDWISNVDATRHILERMRITGNFLPTVMLSSVKPYKVDSLSTTSYGNRTVFTDGRLGINEDYLLEPDEPYAASKMAQSALAMAYGRTYDIPVTVLRCSNLYGDAPCHGPRHGWLTWFCISAALDWPIELQGTGQQTRDMLFSNDVSSAVLVALDKIKDLQGNVYNIGGGMANQISCLEAFNALERIIGKSLPSISSSGRKNEDMLFVTDYRKFNGITNWTPVVSVLEGMRCIVEWALENAEALKDIYGV